MASSPRESSSPKSKVEKFLAASWFNLMRRDDRVKQPKETTKGGKETAPRRRKKKSSTNNEDEQRESSGHAPRRGRPISNLGWLPPGWERITKSRTSGQKDTFYREIETNRTMRSSYDVTSYVEFGRIIKKDKEKVKPLLEAKYGLKFPKERRREYALMEALKDSVPVTPAPLGSLEEENSAEAAKDQKEILPSNL